MRDLKADLELCNRAIPCLQNVFTEWDGKVVLGFGVPGEHVHQLSENEYSLIAQASDGWLHAIERAIEAEAKLEKAKDLIRRWFDGEIGAFGVMDALIIDLEFDIDGIPDEALEYHNIKRKEVLVDEA